MKGGMTLEIIKYRAWIKEEKKMMPVEFMSFPLGKPSGKDIVCGEKWYSIKEVELMEATCFEDANGNRIFRGDVLEDSVGDRYAIAYDALFGKYVFTKDQKIHDIILTERFSIVGNVFEMGIHDV